MEMRRVPILQKKPSEYESAYPVSMEITIEELEEMLALLSRESTHISDAQSAWESVRWLVREDGTVFGDNDMDKFIFLIACMLFMIHHDTTDEEIAFEVKWDIMDFETGDYDDMFTPEELVYLKADIRKINAYLDEHPHLIEGVAEARAKAQSRL